MTDLLNKVTQGDCLEVMKDIPDGSVDMILCDLPYGTTACKWDTIIPLEPLWEQYERIIKDNGAIVLTATQPFSSALIMSNPRIFKYEWIWDRVVNGHPLNAKKQPLRRHESVCVFYKKQCTYNPQMIKISEEEARVQLRKKSKKGIPSKEITGKFNTLARDEYSVDGLRYNYPTSILSFNAKAGECNPHHRLHPTQKPVTLFEYLIQTYTNEGEVVLDNCIGSGTTAVAAINTGRQFIGIEQEAEYVEIANNRISETLTEKQSVECGESKCDCRTINRCVDGKCKYK